MTPIDIATEKMLLGKDESIVELFFTVRQIVIETDYRLEESIKWGMPHFDYKGIICGIGAFKNHVSIWFHKGDYLSNELNLFKGDFSTKSMGHLKFSNLEEIDQEGVQAYLKEAIVVNEKLFDQKKTSKTRIKKPIKKLIKSPDFQTALSNNLMEKDFFERLTITQKNGFLQHVEESKSEATKQKRIERCLVRLKHSLKTIY